MCACVCVCLTILVSHVRICVCFVFYFICFFCPIIYSALLFIFSYNFSQVGKTKWGKTKSGASRRGSAVDGDEGEELAPSKRGSCTLM